MKLRKILAPTDRSEVSLAGLRYALEVAESVGAEVVVFHVVDYRDGTAVPSSYSRLPELLDQHERQTEEFFRARFPELMSTVQVSRER